MCRTSLNVLAIGEGWPSQEPGGLNTYFQSVCGELSLRHHIEALICGSDSPEEAKVFPVTAVASPESGMLQRHSTFRSSAKNLLSAGDVDVVYTHFAPYALGPALEAKKRNIPLVMSFHGPWAEEMRIGGSGAVLRMKALLADRIERKVYAMADRLIVLSRSFRDLLHKQYGVPLDKIRIVPGAVDIERFRPPADKEVVRRKFGLTDRVVVLTVRRLVERMGLRQLLEAWSEVVQTSPEALLLIGGRGPLKGELETLVSRLGLEKHVTLLDYVSDDLLPLYYQAADLFVVPTQALEGFGLITVEALASGLPVAATPVGGNVEIIQPFRPELLFDGKDAGDIAAGLIQLLKRRDTWPDARSCRSYAESRFTWEQVAGEVGTILTETVREKGGGAA